ncbi:hypothetical protein ACHAXM_001446 [Skeletonema potamos]|jgi:hypothetical protein
MSREHLENTVHNAVSINNNRCRRRHPNDNEDNNEAKRKKTDWDHQRAYRCVVADYFDSLTPLFDDKQFERNLRITPTLAEIILNRLAATDEWWTLRWDCTKRMSNAPQVKLIAALKIAAYGESFSAWQDYCQMGESTARECLSKLMKSLVDDDYFSME